MLPKITVNGEVREIDPGLTVTELLLKSQVRYELVTVEVNGHILQKLDYDHAELKDGDQVEIVFYMGGGDDQEKMNENL